MSTRNVIRLALAAGVALAGPAGAAPRAAETPPDLTRGETKGVDRKLTYNLGATGLRGWIYSKPETHFDGLQGRTTARSRQILVTHVGAKSPADGVMQVGDVILGAGGKPFSDDARKGIAAAIQEAEKEANGGILKLTRWREGQTEEVQLKLRVMGTYSDTAPYNCPKSKRILEDACKALERERLEPNWHGAISGLALLATGNPAYLPQVQALARGMVPSLMQINPSSGTTSMMTWEWGYQGLFLAEYFLLTRDTQVEGAVHKVAGALARGQSLYGTFGHGMAEPAPDGGLHGSIPPYGPVNEAGIPANLAIMLGKKCGTKDPEVDAAVERALSFFGYYVDKGAIPYGEHEPWPYHENNGKNSMCAVMFSLQPGQFRAARFFAKMAVAGYRSRECGHTGQGFSYLWGALGANAGGPAAAAAFFKEASWHLDLVRRCDGTFTYDGGEQYGPGRTDDDTYYGKSSYNGLSPNATYVLTYALPLKKLWITGRGANEANGLNAKDVADAIASGRFDTDRKRKTPEELVAAFGDWSPVVRSWAAEELAARPEAKGMVSRLIALAEGQDPHVIQGACETLGRLRAPEALAVLVRRLAHDDRWVRFKAAAALKEMRDAARPVLNDLLKALVATAEPLRPIPWADPIQLAHGQLAEAVFGGLLRDSIRGVDPQLLYPAVRAVAQNPDGMARATLRRLFEQVLTAEDVQALAPEILASVKTRCPADTMFGNEIRMGGFKALTRYFFKEGIGAGVIFAKTQGGHGSQNRTGEIMKEIVRYGSAAREAIPGLRELIVDFNEQVKAGRFPGGELNNQRVKAVEDAIRAIEAAPDHPELRTIGPAKAAAGAR